MSILGGAEAGLNTLSAAKLGENGQVASDLGASVAQPASVSVQGLIGHRWKDEYSKQAGSPCYVLFDVRFVNTNLLASTVRAVLGVGLRVAASLR